jgi:hypothetical protein
VNFTESAEVFLMNPIESRKSKLTAAVKTRDITLTIPGTLETISNTGSAI